MTDMTAYLDYNATTPVKPGVAAAIADALAVGGNPSSVHRNGRLAHAIVEGARDQVGRLVGAASQDVIFTSGGTEANNLALNMFAKAGRRLIVSAVEHLSVLATGDYLDASVLPVDANGVVDLGALEEMLVSDERPALVSVMFANNETGVIQPVAQVAEIVHRHGALMHCDAVQAPGRVAVDMKALGADLMSLSAHKIAGPMGCGALVISPAVGKLSGWFQGGGQERGLRPGSENVSGIAGIGAAAELSAEDLAAADRVKNLRDDLERRLQAAAPDVLIFGNDVDRLNNTTCITMPGVASETQVMAFDLAGIAVSAGSACSSGKVTPSHVLQAMGVEPEIAECAIRISLGWQSTEADVDRLVTTWTELHDRLGDVKRALPAA